ncbi:MAG: alpha/beta hydrolase [Alphaproteobacteria bacterium]|nr:MAG: alpha/beta hydrolase [Alphaproteobacteria bacterium]
MKLSVNGAIAHASTGGRRHAEGRPWLVFLHGAGANHLAWVLQARALAYDGFNVLAPDLPGHYLSDGAPIEGIAAQARWVLDAMDAAGAAQAVLVGHSQGGLIALEVARAAPQRVRGVVFIGTAAAIPVNPALIETAENDEERAFASMVSWALGPDAHRHDNTWPGASHVNFGIETMRLNRAGTLAADLRSCAAYEGGIEAARGLACPTLCIFARLDRMTPLKNGLALAAALPDNETVIVEGSGHTLPTERPREVNAAIRRFLAKYLTA